MRCDSSKNQKIEVFKKVLKVGCDFENEHNRNTAGEKFKVTKQAHFELIMDCRGIDDFIEI